MFDIIYIAVVGVLSLAVIVASALPFVRSHRWWVRACDFPRVQILVVAIATVIAAWFLPSPWRWAVMAALVACIAYQAFRIFPFTPFARTEMRLVDRNESGSQVTLLSSNVEMPNDHYDDVADMIEQIDADVVFLMETDQTWHDNIADAVARYETVVTELRDNYYGMIFATRLEVIHLDILYLTPGDTPTLFAELRSRSGHKFRFVGLHPRPPVPGEDTTDRDAEMVYAARFAAEEDMPVITAGDFNDAAWSHTSRHFKRVGGYLDPRVGRGMVASFDANSRLMRAPIDQFYATPNVAVVDFRRGPHIGSDHFPMIVRIDLDRDVATAANRQVKPLDEATEADVTAIFDEYRRKLGDDPSGSDA